MKAKQPVLTEFERNAINDRFEGFELADFLEVPTDVILQAIIDAGLLDDEDVKNELLEFAGVLT